MKTVKIVGGIALFASMLFVAFSMWQFVSLGLAATLLCMWLHQNTGRQLLKVPCQIQDGKLNFDRPFTHTIFTGVEKKESILYVHFDLKPIGHDASKHMRCFLQIQQGEKDLELHSRAGLAGDTGSLMGKLYLR